MDKSSFDIEVQWKLYLERVDLKESDLPYNQYREMRRTFFGAYGQMLAALLAGMPERAILNGAIDQVATFWKNENKKQNER